MSSDQKNCEGVERLESSAIRQSAPLEPLVRKRGLHESSSDLAYWLSQSPQTRIAALEEIRQEYELWRYGAQTRLERVYTIVKRKRS